MGYGLYVLIGAVIGGGCVWLIYDIKAKRIIDGLQKRLGIAEAENLRIPPLEQQIAQTKVLNAELREAIAALKADVAQKTQDIAELKADVAQKAQEIAGLNAQLIEQAKAAQAKLSMLNEAQGRFCQAMAALSETALNCDNEEFIRVMEVNVTAFERTLLEDIGKWQSRDLATTQEVCELADSEQAATPLFERDQAMEGLIAADEPGVAGEGTETAEQETVEVVRPVDDLEVVDEAADVEEGADSGEDMRLADEADMDAVQEEPVMSLTDAPAADGPAAESVATGNDAAGVTQDLESEMKADDAPEVPDDRLDIDAALIEDRTEMAVADLERELENELALELQDSLDDAELKLDFGQEYTEGETGQSPADTAKTEMPEATPSLKFPIQEIPASDCTLSGHAAGDDGAKKKLNPESGSRQVRREAV